MTAVLVQTLRMRRRSLIWWSIAIAGMIVFYSAFYPSIHDQPSFNDLLKSYPKAMTAIIGHVGDITSPSGYLSAEIFSLMLPIVLLIFTIGFGSREIAGEEEEGALDLLLTTPLSRSRLVLARAGAMVLATSYLGFIAWIALIIATRVFDMDIGIDNLAAATFMAVLIATTYGSVALLAGAATGRRAVATSVATAAAAAAYLLRALATVESLHDWQVLSPFYYYNNASPLVNGFDVGDGTVLLVLTAVFITCATVLFRHRDLH